MKPKHLFTDDDREFIFALSMRAGVKAEEIASALTDRHQQELRSKAIPKITATEVSQQLKICEAKSVGRYWTDGYLDDDDDEYKGKFRTQWRAYGSALLSQKRLELPKDRVLEFTQLWDHVRKARAHFQDFMNETFPTGDQYQTPTDQSDHSEQGQEPSVPEEGPTNREQQLEVKEKELLIRDRELAYQERQLAYQERELAYQERELPYKERKRVHQDKEQAFQETAHERKRARHHDKLPKEEAKLEVTP
ncbi:MAG: hypothetical protein Q9167_002115 [Letrouitia subvulpina]